MKKLITILYYFSKQILNIDSQILIDYHFSPSQCTLFINCNYENNKKILITELNLN